MNTNPLELIKDKRFERESVEVDNRHFEGCTFIECTFVYRGGPFNFVNLTTKNCGFDLRDSAMWTLQFFATFQIIKPEFIARMNAPEGKQ
jgi:hypothetical protein